mgnify:CR=1 FL=1
MIASSSNGEEILRNYTPTPNEAPARPRRARRAPRLLPVPLANSKPHTWHCRTWCGGRAEQGRRLQRLARRRRPRRACGASPRVDSACIAGVPNHGAGSALARESMTSCSCSEGRARAPRAPRGGRRRGRDSSRPSTLLVGSRRGSPAERTACAGSRAVVGVIPRCKRHSSLLLVTRIGSHVHVHSVYREGTSLAKGK